MANAKKPRKKGGHSKVASSDLACRNLYLITVRSLGDNGVQLLRNGKFLLPHQFTRAEYHLVFGVPRNWTFYCGVMLRNAEGDVRCTGEVVELANRLPLDAPDDALRSHLHDCLNDVVASQNPDDVLAPFTIGSPEGKELSDHEICHVLINLLHADSRCHTPREIDEMRQKGLNEIRPFGFDNRLPKSLERILHQHGITSFADMREKGLTAIHRLKGIGEKRLTQLVDGFSVFLDDDRFPQMCAFEEAYYQFKHNVLPYLPPEPEPNDTLDVSLGG